MSSSNSQFRYLSQLMDGIVSDIGRFLDYLPVAGLILNRDGAVLACNERAANFLMIDPESRVSSGLSVYVSPSSRADLAGHLNEVITNKREDLLDIRILLADGQEISARLISKSLALDSDLCLSILVELEHRKDQVHVLSHLAYYDALTGLPNRLLFNDRLRWAISDARRRQEQLAVMLIDLDDFKRVNDTLGHSAGDQVLKAVSARMLACLL
ncbi:MAG: diguanylate cyclase domain-containing protein [Saccharofermentanales bacterium]